MHWKCMLLFTPWSVLLTRRKFCARWSSDLFIWMKENCPVMSSEMVTSGEKALQGEGVWRHIYSAMSINVPRFYKTPGKYMFDHMAMAALKIHLWHNMLQFLPDQNSFLIRPLCAFLCKWSKFNDKLLLWVTIKAVCGQTMHVRTHVYTSRPCF